MHNFPNSKDNNYYGVLAIYLWLAWLLTRYISQNLILNLRIDELRNGKTEDNTLRCPLDGCDLFNLEIWVNSLGFV